jgi:hypothetical protein
LIRNPYRFRTRTQTEAEIIDRVRRIRNAGRTNRQMEENP